MFQGFEFVDAHSPKECRSRARTSRRTLRLALPTDFMASSIPFLGVLRAKAVAVNNGLDVLELLYRCAEEPLAIAWHNTMVTHDDTRQNQRSSGVASEWSAAELRA